MDVKLHDIGEGMHEAEILHYFVKKGERVKHDAPLVEIQTDKMTAELTAPSDGIVDEINFELGEVVEVGTTILTLVTEQKEPPAEEKPPVSSLKVNESVQQMTLEALPVNRAMASPHTRRIAREQEVDIEKITGSGPAGRVLDEDIYSFLDRQKESVQDLEEAVPDQQPLAAEKEQPAVKTIPFKGRRKQIARKMTQSLYTAPHVTHFDEVDMTDLLNLKSQLKLGTARQDGRSISVTAFFIKALQLCLQEFPIFNSKLDEEKEEIHLEPSCHIGLATGTEEGLIVPVLKHVEQKSMTEIHREMKDLTKRAVENKLSSQEIRGGTFTISNVGPMGSTGATPILNYPEAGLMAFHKTKKMPVVIEDEIVIRQMMNLTLTFDHRVADGSQAVVFTNRFIDYIEHPHLMLVELI